MVRYLGPPEVQALVHAAAPEVVTAQGRVQAWVCGSGFDPSSRAKGVAEQKRHHLPEAAKAYSEAVRIRPDAKQAQVNLGIVKQESGDLTGAREAYERALKIAPDQGDVIYNLASVMEQQGEKDEAERLYVKLLSRNPDWEDAWFRLGYLRLARNDYRGGAEAFHACVKKRAAWPEAQLNLGLCNWNLGDRDGAAKAFEAVLASDPKSIDALRGLAALAVEREDLDKALDLQAKLIEAGAEIRNSVIRGPAMIGERSRIINSYVGPFTSIYHDCLIEDTEIEHSLVLEHSVIHGVGRIEDSLIGRYVVMEPSAELPRAHRLMVGDHSRISIAT